MTKRPSKLDRLNASLDAELKAFAPAQPKHKARRSKPLVWDGDSACFDDLRYSASAGGVFATFADGSQYFYDMTRADAKDWFGGDVGRIFNSEIR